MEDTHAEMVACLARVRNGDEAAARELVDRVYPLVLRVVRGHRPRAVPEEDLAQEVLIKMFTRLDQYRQEVPFEHWVSRIALTTCLDHLRAQYRRPEWRLADLSEEESRYLEECCAADTQGEAPGEAMAARELAGKLLEHLNPKDRVVVTLLDLEGYSVAEVAALTGMNGTLIKVRAFRARRKLRRLMEQWRKEKKI
ncbi:MAG: RNA polymerase subunit sigma-24 [Verrucomicrobia bacterium Tous-C9LFEB]|nr:MAG: RNA polymerase subunit sigma-24 [Verrucomicrobia bacterium Tous-C9LFEB]